MMRGVRRDAGFSLIEVMIAMVVLTVAIAIFMETIAQNVRLEAMNAETNVAVSAANSFIEEKVHPLSYAQVISTSFPQTFVAQGLGNDGGTLRLMTSGGSLQVGTATMSENPQHTKKTVEVTVTWRSATGSNRALLLMTEIVNY
jgi:prepilin-type N-terminal cleavage/methylation domain-containing protein